MGGIERSDADLLDHADAGSLRRGGPIGVSTEVSKADFTAFRARHIRGLTEYLRRRGYDADSVEDATQEAFVAAYTRWDTVRAMENPNAWLGTVARRAATRLKQSNGWYNRNSAPEVLTGALSSLDEISKPVSDGTDELTETIVLRDAVAALSDRYSSLITMIDLEERSFHEVAVMMGTTTSQIHKLRKRALETLRRELSDLQPIQRAIVPRKRKPSIPYEAEMRRLAQRRREVLERYVVQGMEPRDIANDLGITNNCARVNLSKAFTELSEKTGDSREKVKSLLELVRGPAAFFRRIRLKRRMDPRLGGPNLST